MVALFLPGNASADREKVADAEALIKHFEAVYYGVDHSNSEDRGVDRPMVIRQHPYKVVLFPTMTKYEEFIRPITDQLSKLTGYRITITRSPSFSGDFSTWIATDLTDLPFSRVLYKSTSEEWQNFLKEWEKKTCMVLSSIGYAYISSGNFLFQVKNVFLDAAIVLKRQISAAKAKDCIVAGLVKQLAGFKDVSSNIVRPSIFNEPRPSMTAIPLNDKILIRAVYDLFPDRDREISMKTIRKKMPLYVKSVRENGIESIYHR